VARPIRKVRVNGRKREFMIYELLGITTSDDPELKAPDDAVRLCDLTREASIYFERGELDQAARRYEDILRAFPDDPVARRHFRRVRQGMQLSRSSAATWIIPSHPSHSHHAQIARRVTLSHRFGIAETPASAPLSPIPPRHAGRFGRSSRHVRRVAMDAQVAPDERGPVQSAKSRGADARRWHHVGGR